MTNNEINNLVYLCLKYIAGFQMRTCDFQVVLMMYNSTKDRSEDNKKILASTISDMIWDHIMGEPDEPSLEDVETDVAEIFKQFFEMPDDVRNSVEEIVGEPGTLN